MSRNRREWVNPGATTAANRALTHGRRVRSGPGSDRCDRLICHGLLARPIPIALLTKAVALPSRLALLVATVSLMSLPTPNFQPAFRTAIALATVATDADCERRPAGHMGAKPKAQNSVRVDLHMSHFEIMSPEPDGGPGWLRVSPVGGDY